MTKSLTPLVLIMGAVLLMSIIIINTKYAESASGTVIYSAPSHLELSPFSRSRKKAAANKNKGIPDSQELKVDTATIFEEAQLFLKRGDPEGAEDRLRTYLIFEPDNLQALTILGEILYRSRKYKDAELIFRKQLSINPKEAEVYNNLSSALAKQNKFEEAVKTAEAGLKIEPESPALLLNLSGMYSTMGEKKTSVEYFKKVYEKIGSDILQISSDPTLKNIQTEPEFISIVKKAERQLPKTLTPPQK